jgi:hypothetical protein
MGKVIKSGSPNENSVVQLELEFGSSVESVENTTVEDTFSFEWLRNRMRAVAEYDMLSDCIVDGVVQDKIEVHVLPYMSYLMQKEHNVDIEESIEVTLKGNCNHATKRVEIELSGIMV